MTIFKNLWPCLFIIVSFQAHAKLGFIETSKGPKLSFYEEKDGYYLTEWDIMVEPVRRRRGKNKEDEKANSRRFGKWKGGVIPYLIDPSLPNQKRLTDAIDYFHQHTSIRLVERNGEKDYIYFKNNGDKDCSSFIGKKGGKQNINVPSWCQKGSLIHEILHALGFNHEQSRPDRRKYIKIHWRNISLKNAHNFFLSPFAKTYGTFDLDSIMLYPSFNSFAKNPEKPTMSLRNGETFGAQRKGMSDLDIEALEAFYR
jgi:hypothetical protein